MAGKAVVIVGVTALLVFAALALARYALLARIQQLQMGDQADEILKLLGSPFARIVFPKANRQLLELQAYLLKNDDESANRTVELLLVNPDLGPLRREVVSTSYDFYLRSGRYKQAKSLLEELKSGASSEAEANEYQMYYDIFANKSTAYIERMEALLKTTTPKNRVTYAYLLSKQYESKGDAEKAAEYSALFESYLTGDSSAVSETNDASSTR